MRVVRVLVTYFSGTGNTEYAARYLVGRVLSTAGERGVGLEVERRPVETLDPHELARADLPVVGFPVFELRAPLVVREFLEAAPAAPSGAAGAFLFCTKGFAAGNALRRTFKPLKERGYSYLGGASVKMPGSDGLALSKPGSRFVKRALERDYDEIPELDSLAEEVVDAAGALAAGAGLDELAKRPPFSVLDLLFGWTFHLLYKVLERSLRGKFHAEEDACTRCRTCERVCPVGAVSVDEDGVHFGQSCVLCLRCLHQCPAEAVQVGKWTKGKFRWKGPKGDFKPLG
ncbi:MAG: EFR1 family ferrodoxin [Promethearchaeota archaeon]